MMRSRHDVLVALVGGVGAFALRAVPGPEPAILMAVVAAALLGAALDRLSGYA